MGDASAQHSRRSRTRAADTLQRLSPAHLGKTDARKGNGRGDVAPTRSVKNRNGAAMMFEEVEGLAQLRAWTEDWASLPNRT